MNYLLYFIGAFALTTMVMPLAIGLGKKYFIDIPNNRKLHKQPIPRSGGIALLSVGFLFVVISPVQVKLLTPLIIIFFVGLLDDLLDIKAKYKFLAQIFVSIIAYYSGIQIDKLSLFGLTISLGYLSFPITIMWLTVIMNAFNLIDGLDGLAATLFLISSLFLSILSLIYTHHYLFMILVIITGATLGFLKYNLHPAKVFLGDAGSLSLGYIMAVATANLITSKHSIDFIGVSLLIFIPLLDTTWAIIRRIINKKPIFKPDKGHIHHVLLEGLKSDKLTLYITISWSYLIGVLGLIYNFSSRAQTKFLVLLLTALSSLIFYNIHKIKQLFSLQKMSVIKSRDK